MANPEVQTACATQANPDVDRLLYDGFSIHRSLVSDRAIKAVSADLFSQFEKTPFCSGDFYGSRTKRFGRLLTRSPSVSDLVLHPTVLAIAQTVLGPWCDTIQLNLTQAIEVHPGALAQMAHRDQDMWCGDIGVREYLINVIWPLDPFRAENGATLIWPGSHGAMAVNEDPPGAAPIVAACDPGDAIIFLGSTLHGAGANVCRTSRRAIIVSYALGWLKPYENQWLAYPPAIARHFSPELAGLVGYRQHRPNLGNYEGQCPSVLLQDSVASQLGAIDALRPDQTALLAAHVTAGACLRQCPPTARPHAQSCPSDAAVFGLGRTGRERTSRRPAAALCRNLRLDAVSAVDPCRRRWPYAHRRADGRGQIGAAGDAGAPVPTLSAKPHLHLRQRSVGPRRGARHGRCTSCAGPRSTPSIKGNDQ